jgi:hypothetical protein
MERISRMTFWQIIKPELTYYNKTWRGETDEAKKANERTVLAMYYKELSHATQFALENAFRLHRQSETTFPKIAQILRHCPKPVVATKLGTHQSVEMPKGVADELARLKSQYKLDDSVMGESRSLVANRWPNTDWTETFKRWNEENELRAEKKNERAA